MCKDGREKEVASRGGDGQLGRPVLHPSSSLSRCTAPPSPGGGGGGTANRSSRAAVLARLQHGTRLSLLAGSVNSASSVCGRQRDTPPHVLPPLLGHPGAPPAPSPQARGRVLSAQELIHIRIFMLFVFGRREQL